MKKQRHWPLFFHAFAQNFKMVLTGTQTLYLWSLALDGGEGFLSEQSIVLAKKHYQPLETQRLIEAQRRKNPASGRLKKAHILTDQGWDYLANHIHQPIVSRTTKSTLILSRLLHILGQHLHSQPLSLVDFLCPSQADASQPTHLIQQIRHACLALGHGNSGQRLKIADLRQYLAHIHPTDLDQTLAIMEQAGSITLRTMEDPKERTKQDDASAITIAGTSGRHLIYLES